MVQVVGDYRVGEDIVLSLDAVTGDVGTVAIITAAMKPVRTTASGGVMPIARPSVPLDVTARPAAGAIPAGWNIALSAAATTLLAPGLYSVDARLVIGSAVEITDTSAIIRITRSAFA